jgi:lipoprotein-releasing system permease protein
MLSWKIARRYLLAKKSTNAINIISGISVAGLTIGAAALVLVLSAFNGFEKLIANMMSNFNPDVKVVPLLGKTFREDTLVIQQLRALKGVAKLSRTLEEVAFFEYDKSQDFGVVKGVDDQFHQINHIDSTVRGKYRLQTEGVEYAILGSGIYNVLGVNSENQLLGLNVYMPKRGDVGPLQAPFTKRTVVPSGVFVMKQDLDNQYIITSLDFVRDLLDAPDELAAIEIKLKPQDDPKQTLKDIQKIVGPKFSVKDRYRQDEGFLKLMNIEKWMSYSILSLTILLVAFNLIGSLWMIVLEKKDDITILRSMGADTKTIRNIFLNQGLLLCLLGLLLGFLLALILFYIQMKTNHPILRLPDGFAIDRYPLNLRLIDFIVVATTVLGIGTLASLPPAIRATK